MLSYLVHFIHAFLPAALMAGLLIAFWTPLAGNKTVRALLIALAAGLLGGALVYGVALRQETLTAARAYLYGAGIAAVLLNAGNFQVPEQRGKAVGAIGWGAALLMLAVLAAADMFLFLGLVAEQALSAISVLNTELILNIGGILSGALLVFCFIPLTAHLGGKNSNKVVSSLLLIASILLILPWCAEVLLGLMRLEAVELTSPRLSFVAKTGKYSALVPYFQLLIVVALALLSSIRKSRLTADTPCGLEKSEQRKARSLVLFEMRWFKSALTSVCVIAAILLYNDLYASRPPQLSPALRVTPDAAGLVKVKIDAVGDGNLHRYSYVTEDGHVVRFFLINRLSGHSGQKRIGVVYDACMLCGDMGYIQQKNDIICIACNVRIFVPSIGKEGGCNPIPLKHEVQGDVIVISAQELDKGARYFSEVVPVKVKDPVTGKMQSTLNAPYRYEYKGRTFYFESDESEQKFRNAPETYAGEQPARYLRVQGYQES